MLTSVSREGYYTCLQEVCVVDTIKGDVINEGHYSQSLVFDPQWILRWTAGEVISGEELLENFHDAIEIMNIYFRVATDKEVFLFKLSS